MTGLQRYAQVFATFARNSLVRDMTFRANFLIEFVSSTAWMLMNLGFYLLVYGYTNMIGDWTKYEFFVFLATTMIINSLVQTFFMPNAQEMSELVRTGGLDFALLKPIDSQFLLSLNRLHWSSLGNFFVGLLLLFYALWHIPGAPFSVASVLLYPFYVFCGVAIMYSIMISLAATSIWLGRNQTLYDFWFYITNFSRYPMEIYGGNALGTSLRLAFTYVVPVLVVINVPARILAKPFDPNYALLAVFAIAATLASLALSRWIFTRSLKSYRSASS